MSARSNKFDEIVTVRMTKEDKRHIESIAKTMGLSPSKAIRMLIIQKPTQMSPEKFAKAEGKHKADLALHSYRSDFRDLTKSIADMVSVYGKSLDMKDGKGRPVLSTSQTIEHIRRVGATLMRIQDMLNDIHEAFGSAQRVHDAMTVGTLDPLRGKVLGAGGGDSIPEHTSAPGEVLPAIPGATSEIPMKYRIMNQMNLYGKIAEQPEMINDRNGVPFLHLVLSCEPFAGKGRKEILVDIIYPRPQEKFVQILSAGSRVSVTGTLDTGTYAYGGSKSGAAYTVRADNVSVGSSAAVVFAGVLTADASAYSDGVKEMMRIPLSVQLSAGRSPKYVKADALRPLVKDLLPLLHEGVAVTVAGTFDPDTYEFPDGGKSDAEITIWVNDIRIG